jgi:nucleoside-diphosphate-sugar epimerase
VDLCHVDNAASATLLALESVPAVGRSYFITDGMPVLFWEWIDLLCDTFGLARPATEVSARTAYGVASVVEALWRTLHLSWLREPPLTRYAVTLFSQSSTFSVTAARRDLGYQPHHDVDRGLRELKAWVDGLGGVERFVGASVHERRRAFYSQLKVDAAH